MHSAHGHAIPAQDSMLYLGSTVHSDGKLGCEVSRKIGAASSNLNVLQEVGQNSSLAIKRKLKLFDACVLTT